MNTDKPDVIKYLLGEGTLLGCWWDEKPNWIGTAKFWWRKPLRETFEQTQSKISSLESDRERLLSALKDVMKIVVNNETHHGYRNTANKLITEIESK